MTRKHGKTPEDLGLWHRVAENIAPLPPKKKRKAAKIKIDALPTKPALPVKPERKKPAAPPLPSKPPAPPVLPELAHGRAPGLDARSHDKLRGGKMPIEARIDLHGHTLDAAHRALIRFMDEAWERERRVLLVITGKGSRKGEDGETPRATLRESVPRWLNERHLRPRVLAISQAQPKHGGAGALYVLLKRRR